ncbi:MAG TPA: aquaporin [Gemmataceae bacterium]|nr:aquaporin [Gemmataceae bacterium]
MLAALRRHWPEYLMEAFGLGLFMASAGAFAVLLFHPDSPVASTIPDADVRRVLMGLAMGVTAVVNIYSPWGRRSGAHLNPATTLTFWRLGKVTPADAGWYAIAQFAGGTAGAALTAVVLRELFMEPPVSAIATVPGPPGVGVAFLAELAISFVLLTVVLRLGGARVTGLVVGALVAAYIAVEAPLSGMSMNPARTFASAAVGGQWTALWVYFLAPPLGMLLAAEVYLCRTGRATGCAKFYHATDVRCIFCGYRPPAQVPVEAGPVRDLDPAEATR